MADRRHVVGFRRVRLSNGRYLQLAVLDKPGPRGGHTVGYIRTGKGGERIYPGHLEQPAAPAARRRRKHGRQQATPVPKRARRIVVKRKPS